MKNTKVLELLNNGEIEELKALLKKEIYEDNLKGNGNAMKRYSAMKRYFKYKDKNRNLAFNLPCKNIEVNGKIYNSFIDGYSFVLTSESIGEIEAYDNSKNAYPNIEKMVDFSSYDRSILNIDEILAEAKSKGYQYKKSEIGDNESKYFLHYKNIYLKIGLIDKAYRIIDDGKIATVYYKNEKSPLFIETNMGIAAVLPCIKVKTNEKIIIEAKEEA